MQQVLVATPATVSQSWYLDGVLIDPGEVTVTITNLAGTALETDAATSGTGAAARTFPLTTTHTADLDTLRLVWTSPTKGVLTSRVEIVGDLLFTEAEARAFDGSKLENTTTYTDAAISAARARITQDFEQILGVPVAPIYRRIITDGDGSCSLLLPDALGITRLRSIETREAGTQTWTAFTADELADVLVRPFGMLTRDSRAPFLWGVQNVRVGYEVAHPDAPTGVPAPLKQAALLVLTGGTAQSIVGSDIDYRATSFSDGIGTIRFLTPGLGRGDVWYSEPDVNRILQTYRHRVPGLA